MAKAHKIIGVEPLQSYRENARIILPQRLAEVYTWEPFIRDEMRREELHNMRISIKRLRYTMELFRIAYPATISTSIHQASVTADSYSDACQYAEFLAVIIDLQERLGDIHDADVVLEVLADYASQSGNRGIQGEGPPGVATLMARTAETRKGDYETFLERWEHLSAACFKQKLLSLLISE